MGEISSSLKDFKTCVGPQLDSMNSFYDKLQEKIKEITDTTTKVRSSFEGYYKSTNQTAVIARFDRINQIYSKISTSVNTDLRSMISDSKTLINLIKELEDINEEIKKQQSIINSNKNDEEKQNIVRNANNMITTKNAQFISTHTQALDKLNALKAKDASLSFVEEFSINANEPDLEDLQYGSLELKEFKASNGEVVDYYIYVPDYGKDVTNLPAMLYMHGGNTHQDIASEAALKKGLGNLLANKEVTPSGILVVPVMRNFDDNGVKAVKELMDDVVQTYDIDTDRISVSGHSYGGITAYKLVNEYPNYFSCVVPISGSEKVTSAFNGVKVWSFNGAGEVAEGNTSFYSGKRAVKEVNDAGGEASQTALKSSHGDTDKETYANKYLSPDGIVENPLEWAFRQVKA